MTARSTIRAIVCFLAVLSLSASMVAIAAPAPDSNHPTEFRELAAPPSTVLLTGLHGRHDHARQGQSVPSCFIFVPPHRGIANPGRLRAAPERQIAHSLWTAGPWTGRAPPAIS